MFALELKKIILHPSSISKGYISFCEQWQDPRVVVCSLGNTLHHLHSFHKGARPDQLPQNLRGAGGINMFSQHRFPR